MSKYSQITIDGKTHRFRKEEADLVRLVREGNKLNEQIGELKNALNAVNEQIIRKAKGRRGDDSVVQIDGIDCFASVQFGQTISFRPDVMTRIKTIYTEEEFNELFMTRVEFKAKKTLETFLQSEQVGTLRRLKQDITQAMQIKVRKPAVRYYEKKTDAAAAAND